MTRITLHHDPETDHLIGPQIRVNGRHVDFHPGVEKIERTNEYTHEITLRGRVYKVWGGRAAGGPKDMWFTEWTETSYDGIERHCLIESKSAKAATLLIWNM